MEEKLKKLYNECILELETIGIKIENNPEIGEIDIKLENRNLKRYGCCKRDIENKKHIEICKWVMLLDEKIIKNTIMHEIIHCFPKCDNHKEEFKKYASYINQNLDYNIKRLGDKVEDYKKSNLKLEEEIIKYNYKIICKQCGQIYYRKRLNKKLISKYRCGKCSGKLQLENK